MCSSLNLDYNAIRPTLTPSLIMTFLTESTNNRIVKKLSLSIKGRGIDSFKQGLGRHNLRVSNLSLKD